MGRPSDALLRWLRAQVDARKENTSTLALKLNKQKAEVRRLLTGQDPLTVDDLILISEALGITEELAKGGVAAIPEEVPDAAEPQWDNQPRMLFQFAFDYGFDFRFFAAADECEDWGGPERVRSQYLGKDIPLQLDAAYHKHMKVRMEDEGVHVLLSFNDGLYDCWFRWTAVRAVMFQPFPPKPVEKAPEPPPKPARGSHLRLVK